MHSNYSTMWIENALIEGSWYYKRALFKYDCYILFCCEVLQSLQFIDSSSKSAFDRKLNVHTANSLHGSVVRIRTVATLSAYLIYIGLCMFLRGFRNMPRGVGYWSIGQWIKPTVSTLWSYCDAEGSMEIGYKWLDTEFRIQVHAWSPLYFISQSRAHLRSI